MCSQDAPQYPGYPSHYWYPQSHSTGHYANTYPSGSDVQPQYNPQVQLMMQPGPLSPKVYIRIKSTHCAKSLKCFHLSLSFSQSATLAKQLHHSDVDMYTQTVNPLSCAFCVGDACRLSKWPRRLQPSAESIFNKWFPPIQPVLLC